MGIWAMLEGFTDASDLLRCGVYILRLRGKVVFVGKAQKGMLAKIATHRSLARKHVPIWLPIRGVVFDEVLIRSVHPDKLDEVYDDLVDTYQPMQNVPSPFVTQTPATIIRRI